MSELKFNKAIYLVERFVIKTTEEIRIIFIEYQCILIGINIPCPFGSHPTDTVDITFTTKKPPLVSKCKKVKQKN